MIFLPEDKYSFKVYIVLVVFVLNAVYTAATAIIVAVVDARIANNGSDLHPYIYAFQIYIPLLERVNNETIPDPYRNVTIVEYGRFNSTYLIFGYILASFIANVCVWRYWHNTDEENVVHGLLITFYVFNTIKYGFFAALLSASSQISDPKLMMFSIAATVACSGYIMYRNNMMVNTEVGNGKNISLAAIKDLQLWLFMFALLLVLVLSIAVLSYAGSQQGAALECDVSVSVISLILLAAILYFETRRWSKNTVNMRQKQLAAFNSELKKKDEVQPLDVRISRIQKQFAKHMASFETSDILVIIGCLDSLYTIMSLTYAAATANGACGVTT